MPLAMRMLHLMLGCLLHSFVWGELVHKSCLIGEAVDYGSAAFTTTLNLLSNTIFSIDLADPSSEMAREFKENRRWCIIL